MLRVQLQAVVPQLDIAEARESLGVILIKLNSLGKQGYRLIKVIPAG